MTNQDLAQEIIAHLTSVPTNPIHRQLVDSDYEDQELNDLEYCSPEFREEYLSAVESGVWV